MLVARSSVPLACWNKEEDQKLGEKKSKFNSKLNTTMTREECDLKPHIGDGTLFLPKIKKNIINMMLICKDHEVQIPGTGRAILSNMV